MSKFRDLKAYASEQQYELLPFNFDRFDADQYILTNMVGEYLLVDSDVVPALIDGSLSSDHSTFGSLRSKHFIRYPNEQAPLQLLALKVRTKFSRLPPFTNLHIFVVTLRCDHSCPYCQVSRQMEGAGSFDMTKDMADRSLDFVFRSPNPAIKL